MNSASPLSLQNWSDTHTKVLIVDDHALFRAGLSTFVNREEDLEACGEADSHHAALDAVRRHLPDVVVVDWSLGNKEAADLVRTLHQDYPRVPVVVLSAHEEVLYADRALRAGAMGYVMKQEASERIVEAIRSVAAGIPYLTDQAMAALAVDTRRALFRTDGLVLCPEELTVPPSADCVPQRNGRETSQSHPVVSIVIPVYNSEHTIERLAGELIDELRLSYRLQLVLVEDGSRDQSAAACQRLHERYPAIVDFVKLSRNFGEHNAVMAGLNYVDGDYCVVMDDDFQNPPAEVRKLIEAIRKGHDVIYVSYESKQHSSFRNLGSRLHNWMATRALGKPRELYLSSFKAMSRFVVREAVQYTGPDPYLDAIILQTTRNISVVVASHEPRKEGKSGYTLRKLIALWGNMIVAFSFYPLRLLGLYGLFMTVAGVGYGLYTFGRYFIQSLPDPDSYERLTATIWFFRGVQLLFISIVGEYVGRIYKLMKREPQFIIRNSFRRNLDD